MLQMFQQNLKKIVEKEEVKIKELEEFYLDEEETDQEIITHFVLNEMQK